MDFDQATGLPPGVQVRIGAAGPDDYYWQDRAAHKGPRPNPTLVAKLNPGYVFIYDITIDAYRVAQEFNPPKKRDITVRVNNSLQMDDILGLEKRLRELGGLVIESEDQEPEEGYLSVEQPGDKSPAAGAADKRSADLGAGT